MPDPEWGRFLNYMEREVRAKCGPQRETLRGGPFEWLQTLSGSAFGQKVGPLTIRFFLQNEYERRVSADHDFTFRGARIELKTGTEHSTPGVFLFEQVRLSQEWDILLCLGFAATSLTFLTLPRPFVEDRVQEWRRSGKSLITPQHGGARRLNRRTARPDTFWLWTNPGSDKLLKPYRSCFSASGWSGRHLRDALALLTRG